MVYRQGVLIDILQFGLQVGVLIDILQFGLQVLIEGFNWYFTVWFTGRVLIDILQSGGVLIDVLQFGLQAGF